jgi:DNA-binding NarL/FixJ family response regulator
MPLIIEREDSMRIQFELEKLTRAELEVLAELAKGKTNREIADHRSTSLSTVQNQVHMILGKLNVTSRTQAVIRAIRRGIIKIK